MTSKDILIHRLEKLLGFDGVEDILEHLLTIESEQVSAGSSLLVK
jgi:hypothetical protein